MRLLPAVLLLASTLSASEADLSVGWISRTPKIDYVWNSSNPAVEGWPAEGAAIAWIAHVRWLGAAPVKSVGFRWIVDGSIVSSGTVDLDAESTAEVELPSTWTFKRHEIVFEIDPNNQIAETNERNNRLLVDSNALALGLYVERGYWNGILPQVKAANIGATTFDDWLQRQVRRFNEMARYAIFPETPGGVIDRWRIDDIHVVEDGALPLVPPYSEARDWGAGPLGTAGLFPNVVDHSVDIQGGFPTATVHDWPEQTPWLFMIGNSIIHEFAHARTMIDSYAWNISRSDDVVNLNPAPPADATSKVVYSSHDHGLMHYDWGHIDRVTAAAMNLMAGRRAREGNYNEPWDLGWFLDEIPASNRVKLVRTDGTPITNASVSVFRAKPVTTSANYAMQFDNTPDFSTQTDAAGVAVFSRSIFPDHITAFVDRTNGTTILKIADRGTTRWAFLESLDFNLAWWRGEKEDASYTVMADAPLCVDQLGPASVSPAPEAQVTTGEVQFQFTSVGGHHYDLYYGVDGGDPVAVKLPAAPLRSPLKATLTDIPPGRIVWWFVDTDAVAGCPPRHSSIYAFDHDLPVGPRRRAVGH